MRTHSRLATLLFCSALLFAACTPDPEKYFDVAVLNCNMIADFGGFDRQLQSPSSKLVAGTTDKIEQEKRIDVVNDKIQFAEDNLKKVKALKETDDTKDILRSSIALHEYVLPVYQKEYRDLAKLYDDGAPKEQINAQAETINNQYYERFDELYKALTKAGKAYAAKHNIKVNWGIETSPE